MWKHLPSLDQLEHLDLRQMGLSVFPEELLSMKQLKSLNIAGNFITELPPGIGGLNRLERLDAYKNRLQALPSEIGKLDRLRAMSLYRNSLSQLPESMIGLVRLRQLNINGNPFESMPSFLSELPALEELYVPWKFRDEFGKGAEKRLVYDTWKEHHTAESVLSDIEQQSAAGPVHSVHFDFGSFRDFSIYTAVLHRYPDLEVIFGWRREAYY